ncbi:MAG: hypothetical protein HYX90_01770 [Chloroflexi bacterium]|nr:hypothetical protein [Chloroflexota bacterium]
MSKLKSIRYIFCFCIVLFLTVVACKSAPPPVVTPPPPILDIEVWINYNSFDYVRSLAVSGDNLWITSLRGVARLNMANGNIVKYTTADGLASNWVAVAAPDQAGNVWFGTFAGASRFNGTSWTTYKKANSGPIDDKVLSISVDERGTVWFATASGASWYDGSTWESHDPGVWYGVVLAGPARTLWFGSDRSLTRLSDVGWESVTSTLGVQPGRVWAIAIDSDGVKWCGTSKGVGRYDGTWKVYNKANSGLASDQVMAVAIDTQGNKWFGTSAGVSKFENTSWTTYARSNSGLPDDFIRAIAVDGKGNKWFGTRAGVTMFDGASWKTYTVRELGLVP